MGVSMQESGSGSRPARKEVTFCAAYPNACFGFVE